MSYPEWQTIRNSNYARARYYPMIATDTPTFMGQRYAYSPADLPLSTPRSMPLSMPLSTMGNV